ncbi:hypothetical protein BCR34DRAFT_586100 [Clohesyomyces aquaticus]|uniref:Uncharacterized protein n=1 Tax=Clohesyomyces aquaticus TaxID=1231657 RepID=A0A1Y1ZV39_9PLEO|nr:hypothetical protein BCR34DRAFT_586100 [Clohesyomyces aquaticus]
MYNPPTPTPRINFLFTHPRTSSHLFTKILNLPAQLSIHAHPQDGYFFLSPTALRFQHNLAGKPLPSWTAQEKQDLKTAFQKSYGGFEEFVQEAREKGKGVFVKEHVLWMVEPRAETRYLYGAGEGQDDDENWTITPSPTGDFDASPAPGKDHTKSIPSNSDTKSPGNETCLPDSILLSLSPSFLIRHPALAFPSLLRTALDNGGIVSLDLASTVHKWEFSYHWLRQLYTWYSLNLPTPNPPYPVILDADDITSLAFMRKYAEAVGLDAEKIRFEWEAEKDFDSVPRIERRMKETILKSKGVVPGKMSKGLEMDVECEKWKTEFGAEAAEKLAEWVDSAMGDWVWLWERRWRG